MTDMPDNPLGEEILDEIELADAERFADALDRIDAGGEPDLDPREDPTLTALAVLTEDLHEVELRATSTPRYASYRARSRDYLLHRVERERMALAAAHAASDRRPDSREEPSRGWGIPFLRLNVLSHFATAAAAAVVVLAFVVMADGGNTAAPAPEQVAAVDRPATLPVTDVTDVTDDTAAQDTSPPAATQRDTATRFQPSGELPGEQAVTPGPAPSTVGATPDAVTPDAVTPSAVTPGSTVAVAFSTQRATPRTLPDQLTYIDTLLGELTTKVERDQPVPVQLLREITESIAVVAYHIETRPDQVTSAQVVAYIHAAADGRVLLAAAVAEEADETALSAARSVAQAGVDTASWYLKYH